MSHQQVQHNAKKYPLPFQTMPVYHKAKFWLGDSKHHRLSSNEYDVIHARPPRQNKRHEHIPGRFDTALVNSGQGNYIGLKGMCLIL